MKKLLAVLLALCVVVGFSFAAPTVGLSLDGTVTLVNQDVQGSMAWDDSYISFAAADEKGLYGISFGVSGDAPNQTAALTINSWKAYGYFFEKLMKVSVGNSRSTDYGPYLGQAGDGTLIQLYPVAGLNVGVTLPYTTTAADVTDIFSNAGIGVAYTIDKVGVLKVYANMASWKPVVGYGFALSAVENLSANLYGTADFTAADAAIAANVSAAYTIGEFTPEFEFDSTITPDFAGTVYVGLNWAKDALSADVDTNVAIAPDFAWGGISADAYYAFDNNFKLGVNVGYSEADGFTFSVPLTFDFAF